MTSKRGDKLSMPNQLPTPTIAAIPEREAAYRLEGVTREYGRSGHGVVAARDINVTIDRGEFVAIVGPSGSGKTTLLQLMGALDRPTSGRITCDGQDLAAMSERDLSRLRRDHIGFVFQQFNLIPTLTAGQNVEAAAARRSSSDRHELAKRLLAEVGLTQRIGHLPSQLSGGEQQRVAIARALANTPSVLLADEPTGNLDSTTGQEILTLLHRICSDHDTTIVLITHDSAIAHQAPRTVRLADGAVVEDSPISLAPLRRH